MPFDFDSIICICDNKIQQLNKDNKLKEIEDEANRLKVILNNGNLSINEINNIKNKLLSLKNTYNSLIDKSNVQSSNNKTNNNKKNDNKKEDKDDDEYKLSDDEMKLLLNFLSSYNY